MATVLKSYNFSQNRGKPAKYPWDQWTDGRIWRLKRGEDFTMPPETFRGALHGWANGHDFKVRTSVVEGDIVIQFTKVGDSGKSEVSPVSPAGECQCEADVARRRPKVAKVTKSAAKVTKPAKAARR